MRPGLHWLIIVHYWLGRCLMVDLDDVTFYNLAASQHDDDIPAITMGESYEAPSPFLLLESLKGIRVVPQELCMYRSVPAIMGDLSPYVFGPERIWKGLPLIRIGWLRHTVCDNIWKPNVDHFLSVH
jgi:hypothetical protein